MLRCIELAKNSRFTAAPNPMVGSVIVHDGKIIGEGYTSAFGGPHAEVNAINSVKNKSLLPTSTLYVSLEPCSHYGKTPPCADLIIKYNIPEVVIGIRDPNPQVAGQGINKLESSGCKVKVGILEKDCKNVNIRFFTYHQKSRPYIILKWAQSPDGYIAPADVIRNNDPKPYWISNSYSRQLVHQWRAEEQAVLVGANTVLKDNPKLNLRHWVGKPPVRIALDRDLSIPGDYHFLNKEIDTLVLTEVTEDSAKQDGICYHYLDYKKRIAEQVCNILWDRNILSVIVEGGASTLNEFIKSGIWDEARVFTGPQPLSDGLKAPDIGGVKIHSENIHSDRLDIFANG